MTSGGTLNPAALVRHIAERSGATLLEHHLVAGVQHWGKRLVLETRARRLVADRVVFALNAYAPRLLPALGAYVRPVRAQMFATERVLPRWLSQPVYSHEGYFYVRQHPSGSVLVGGARHLHASGEVGYADTTTELLQADLEAYLRHHFPHAAGARIERRWSGVMGFSPDGLPVIGAVPGLDGAFFACGFTGHGMAYGFRAGRLLAERVWDLPAPDADLFDPARFGAAARA